MLCVIPLNRPRLDASSQAAARGAELFASSGCARCHGPEGVGGERGPDLQLVRKRMNARQMTHQIHDGGQGMPPYGEALNDAQIADLVAYLRKKRKHIVPTPPSTPGQPAAAGAQPAPSDTH